MDKLSARLDNHLQKMNVVALAAVCCDKASDLGQTRALKREAIEMETELHRIAAELEKHGRKPPVEDRLLPEDDLIQFGQTRLADLPVTEQARLLGNFIRDIRTATHVQVMVRRKSGSAVFTIAVGLPSPEHLTTIRVELSTLREAPPSTAVPAEKPADPAPPAAAPVEGQESTNAFVVLSDPARRSSVDRQDARRFFASWERDSAFYWAAARFLEKSEREWRLVYDQPGKKDVRDPVADVIDAYLAKYWKAGEPAKATWKEGLAVLQDAIDKSTGKSEALPALRPFLLAHLSALGDAAADVMSKNGFQREGSRWGRSEDLALHTLTDAFRDGSWFSDVDAKIEGASSFAIRYAAGLLRVRKAFATSAKYQETAQSLLRLSSSGGPPKAEAHGKALFESFKAAIYCRICQDGKTKCDRCEGKKRREVICDVCHGIGWMQRPDGTPNTLVLCKGCGGVGRFPDAPCPTCKGTGLLTCFICEGKSWREGFAGCKDCKVCGECNGRRETETKCAQCNGRGRIRPKDSFAMPVELCGACDGKAMIRKPCTACGSSGLADCATCGGKGLRDGKFGIMRTNDVWDAKSCEACGGSGWPLPNLAMPCEKCLGLGAMIKPKSDPSKTLE